MPPQYSSISSRTVMPAGARCTPGFFTRPDTENERSPFLPLRPWPANQAAPRSTIWRTQYTVSRLCSSVGRLKRPTCATYGGRRRGMPRLPSIDSIIADSSPQMYAPAPRRTWIGGSAQTGVFHDLGDLLARAFAGEAIGDQPVAAVLAVLRVVDVLRLRTFQLLLIDRGLHRSGARVADGVLSHHHAGGDFAAADAGGRNHAHLFSKGKISEKRLRTGQIARDGVADPHGERRRRHLAFLHDFEMVVERRHLVHLGQRQAHFLRQRGEVRSRQVAVAVVDAVQVLDQQVAAAGGVAQQPPHVLEDLRVGRSALRPRADFAFHADPIISPPATRDS